MDVTLPDGTVIRGVPDGTTKMQLAEKLQAKGFDVPKEWFGEQPSMLHQAVKAFSAPADALTSIASGMVAGRVAGLAGLATAGGRALGLTDKQPAEVVEGVQGAMTYQPRTPIGQKIVGAVGKPFEMLAEGGERAGQGLA